MPKSKTKSADKREKIIKVSLQLFAKYGYDSTTIRMIAQESGISLGLLYNYFNGKNEVLKVIFDMSVIDVKNSFMIPEEHSKPEKKFEHLVDQIFQAVHKNLLFYKLFYTVRMQPSVQKLLAKELSSLHEFILANLESMLVELGYSHYQEEAMVLYGCLDGCSNQYVQHSRSYPIDTVKSGIVRRFKH